MRKLKILGIDLAGKPDNPSGVCILEADENKFCEVSLSTLYSDKEILDKINSIQPSLIVMDAPLSLPKGRCCLDKNCECAVGGHFRQSEREIRVYGPVLPLTFTGMKMLTLRGVGLAQVLREKYLLKETHPRTVQKILGLENLKTDLERYFQIPLNSTSHELDAVLAALCGLYYLNESYVELGDVDEGTIIIPKDKN
ncbi:MAG: DUF429 domain-containing protein [Methanobacteriaceae archaeon]|nr:DUF429 domain-containing protein [Methanobacteriaceae archaeon]